MACAVCGAKIIKVMEFRYTCSGCQGLFCAAHLDWAHGHKCSGYERKLAEHRQKLVNAMPKVEKPILFSL
jgi:hypothetical protein